MAESEPGGDTAVSSEAPVNVTPAQVQGDGSNPWASRFGWPVGPGTLVTVSVSNLERLFETIGQQLGQHTEQINNLTQHVNEQDATIESLRERSDLFLSFQADTIDRFDALEKRLGALQDEVEGLSGHPVPDPSDSHKHDPAEAMRALDARFREFQAWVVQNHVRDAGARTEDLQSQVDKARVAVRTWNEEMDSLAANKDEEHQAAKAQQLLDQWAKLQHNVVRPTRTAVTSRQMLRASLDQLERWQVKHEADGKATDGADGGDGDAAGASGGDGGGDGGDDGDDGRGGGGGAVMSDVASAAGPVLGGVDELVDETRQARLRLAQLLGSFTVGHSQLVERRASEHTTSEVGGLRDDTDRKLEELRDELTRHMRANFDEIEATVHKGPPGGLSRPVTADVPTPMPSPGLSKRPSLSDLLPPSNAVTKEQFDIVVAELENVRAVADSNQAGVGTNTEDLARLQGRVDTLVSEMNSTRTNVVETQDEVASLQRRVNNLEEVMNAPPPASTGDDGDGTQLSEQQLQRIQSQLINHSSHIEDLFKMIKNHENNANAGGPGDEEYKALTDEVQSTLKQHADQLSSILARQAEAESTLSSQIKRKASLSGLQNVAHEVSRKADEAKVSVALQEKVGRELMDKMLDDYMASLDKRLDAVCDSVREERQAEVGQLKKRFQRLLRDSIHKAMEENALHATPVDDGSASRFGRIKIQFCAGCDRPVSRLVGVPVPTVPHQRLPAPHNVSDDFVYRGGGFRVPSRQQRLAAHEESQRGWDSPGRSSPSRPRSANYNRAHSRKDGLRRSESHHSGVRSRTPESGHWAPVVSEDGAGDRPRTAPNNNHNSRGSGRRLTASSGLRTPQPGHSTALSSYNQAQPRRTMAAYSAASLRPYSRDADV